MLILPQVTSNLVLKKEINSDEKSSSLSFKQKGIKKQKKKKSLKNVESTLDIQTLFKNNKKAPCKNIHKAKKQSNHSKVKNINNDSDGVKRKSVRIKQREVEYIGIEDDRQSKATRKKQEVTNNCESSLGTLTTEVSADVVTETNKLDINEDMVSDSYLSDKFDDKPDSDISFCGGGIFCDCNNCEAFRKSQLETKLSGPDKNFKFICGLCNKKFVQESYLIEHEKRKCDSLKYFSCNYCAKRFTTKHYKESHIRKIHSMSVSKKVLNFNCNLCDKNLSSKESLINHKRNLHFFKDLKGTYSCETCEKVYKHECDLNHHTRQFHSDETFVCGHCSDVFKSKRNIIKHIQRIHFPTILKCGECPKTFSSESGLKRHFLLVHSDSKVERGFICETCGKWLSTKLGLRKHLRTHTGEKPYICQVCGKSFRTYSNLYQHSQTHSDKRRFSCELCPKAFRIKHHLRQHMAVHGMAHSSVRRKQRSKIENV